ncbi:MAG TPA: DUF1015 domain-containing protein [Actinomycetota bacterium]|nr:DUF1015 domain-containing protein [Actinomycetota bacterium]
MSQVFPFVGLLFDRESVGSLDLVTTPPYDVVTPAEQRRFRDLSPCNVIRLELGEDLPGDDEQENKYRRAAAELDRWRVDRTLRQTERPFFYAYEMRFILHGRPRRLRGVIGAVELEDWGGSIVPHERTMQGPVEDRLRLVRAVSANLSSIQALFPGPSEPLRRALDGIVGDPPAAMTTDESGVEHRMWLLDPTAADVTGWLSAETLMIADGHHRYATSLRYRDEMRAAHGPGPWDRVMMLLVDSAIEDPPVLPYHRVLTEGRTDEVGVRVLDLHEILDAVDDDELVYGLVTLDRGVLSHHLVRLEGDPPTVCRLHDGPLADLDDTLRFTHDAVEAEDAVRHGHGVAAFILPGTNALRIRSVIDTGGVLPQKSTFFWPKPRSGMVIRALNLDASGDDGRG